MDKKFINNNLAYSFERLKVGLKSSQEILDNYDKMPIQEHSSQQLISAYARAWGKLSSVVETQIMFFENVILPLNEYPSAQNDLAGINVFTQASQADGDGS